MSEELATTGGSDLAVPGDFGIEGMEDFSADDMVMPTLKINHEDGKLVDSLSGEQHDEVNAVVLGLIKQRVLWATEMKDDDHPMCKSYNFTEGHPDEARFPESAAGLTIVPNGTLPCSDCGLKEWGSHPTRDTPWCSEQHTLPLLMQVDPDNPEILAPALLTVQRSGISPSKTYLTAFAREKKPLFTVFTRITLDQRKRGSVDYAVPKFVRAGATPAERHAEFADQYRQIRDFVQTPYVPADEATAAASAPSGEKDGASAPSGASAPAASDDASAEGDLPF